MAKMLDALEKARQERLKRLHERQGAGPEDSAAQPSTGAPAPLSVVAPEPFQGTPPPARPAVNRAPIHPGVSEMVIALHDGQSPLVEQVRQIRSNLQTVLDDRAVRTIVITSPASNEGKSLLCANLAVVLAEDPESQVILIDGDMRKPDQHRTFGFSLTPGLSEYLRSANTIDEVVRSTGLSNLKLISAGRRPDNPTVVLGSGRMTRLLRQLEQTYQWIILDTPPLLPVTDATLLARESTGLILVVRMAATPRTAIKRAQELLAELRLPVLGCILNDFNQKTRHDEYYSRYYEKTLEEDGFRV
jgi:capsular exopolysaccharide synthesis family protein